MQWTNSGINLVTIWVGGGRAYWMGSIYPHVTDCSHWPLVVQSQFFSSKREQKKTHILSSVLMKIQKRLKVYTCIISLIFFYSVSVSHLIHEYKKFTISMFLYFFHFYFTMKFYLAFICLLVIVWTKGKLRRTFFVLYLLVVIFIRYNMVHKSYM